jgi:hypothetical protein
MAPITMPSPSPRKLQKATLNFESSDQDIPAASWLLILRSLLSLRIGPANSNLRSLLARLQMASDGFVKRDAAVEAIPLAVRDLPVESMQSIAVKGMLEEFSNQSRLIRPSGKSLLNSLVKVPCRSKHPRKVASNRWSPTCAGGDHQQ